MKETTAQTVQQPQTIQAKAHQAARSLTAALDGYTYGEYFDISAQEHIKPSELMSYQEFTAAKLHLRDLHVRKGMGEAVDAQLLADLERQLLLF